MNDGPLFEECQRTHDGVADHIEGTFSFLDRSSRPASERVRRLLNEWFHLYPVEHRNELRQKFRADFSVGFFELFLHELLRRLGYQIEIHPILQGDKRSRPDFRLANTAKGTAYLEAIVTADESKEERARNRALAVFYDEIGKIQLPDYYLTLHRIHNPTGKQPSGKKVRSFIKQCIRSLDYNDIFVLSQLGAINHRREWVYREGPIEIEFGVFPVSPENRGRPDHRPIGAYPGGARWGGNTPSIRNKISKKAGKYGHLGVPYIIAINWLGFPPHNQDAIKGLFGTDDPIVQQTPKGMRFQGNPSGVWYSAHQPRNTRVSAVLFTRVFPWNLPVAETKLYLNPWAEFPYDGPLKVLPRVGVLRDGLYSLEGNPLGKILSLPSDWPGRLFD